MRSMIHETLRTHLAQTSQEMLAKLDEVASSLARQLVLMIENLHRNLMQSHTAEMQFLRDELAQSREEKRRSL